MLMLGHVTCRILGMAVIAQALRSGLQKSSGQSARAHCS